ncbi:hypothetical protein HMI56_001291 [Coelomomyces lativittatus]|nr:hypothetical protein HMI56_001291 [Coelomomyces lativittatus]
MILTTLLIGYFDMFLFIFLSLQVLSIDNIGSFVDMIDVARTLLTTKPPEIGKVSISIFPQSPFGHWIRQVWIDFNSRTFSQLCTLFSEFRAYIANSNAIPRHPRHVNLYIDKVIEKLEDGEPIDFESVKAISSLTKEFNTIPKLYYALALHAAQRGDLEFALDSLFEFTSRARHDLKMLVDPYSITPSKPTSTNGVTARMYCWGALAFGQVYAKSKCTEQAIWFLNCAYDQAQLYQDQACLTQASYWLDYLKKQDTIPHESTTLSESIFRHSSRFLLENESTPLDPESLCKLARMKWSSGSTQAAMSLLASSLEHAAKRQLFLMKLELSIRQCDWKEYETLTLSLTSPYSPEVVYLLVQANLRQWQMEEAFSLLDHQDLPHNERWYAWRMECFITTHDHDKALLYLPQEPKPTSFPTSDALLYHFQCARIQHALNNEASIAWSEFLVPLLIEPDVWFKAWVSVHLLQYEFHLSLFELLLNCSFNDVVIEYKLYRLAEKHAIDLSKYAVSLSKYSNVKEKVILKKWI